MKPAELVLKWVEAFNRTDLDALETYYHPDAINHQVVSEPVIGRTAIREMFENEFARANMVCLVDQILEDGEWAILEWKDQLGLRGCGFFQVRNDQIIFQRGYWDRLSFLKQHSLPLPEDFINGK